MVCPCGAIVSTRRRENVSLIGAVMADHHRRFHGNEAEALGVMDGTWHVVGLLGRN